MLSNGKWMVRGPPLLMAPFLSPPLFLRFFFSFLKYSSVCTYQALRAFSPLSFDLTFFWVVYLFVSLFFLPLETQIHRAKEWERERERVLWSISWFSQRRRLPPARALSQSPSTGGRTPWCSSAPCLRSPPPGWPTGGDEERDTEYAEVSGVSGQPADTLLRQSYPFNISICDITEGSTRYHWRPWDNLAFCCIPNKWKRQQSICFGEGIIFLEIIS